MKTQITELLGIEYPVIQGGMAWVADAQLAANVSKAGGIGFTGIEDDDYPMKLKLIPDAPTESGFSGISPAVHYGTG